MKREMTPQERAVIEPEMHTAAILKQRGAEIQVALQEQLARVRRLIDFCEPGALINTSDWTFERDLPDASLHPDT